jgi:hypothetical protein
MTNEEKDELKLSLWALLFILPLGVWEGWVVSQLWSWFVVPLGVQQLGIWHAAGLSTLVTVPLATYKPDPDIKAMLWFAAYAPLVAYGVGAIYHAFM